MRLNGQRTSMNTDMHFAYPLTVAATQVACVINIRHFNNTTVNYLLPNYCVFLLAVIF